MQAPHQGIGGQMPAVNQQQPMHYQVQQPVPQQQIPLKSPNKGKIIRMILLFILLGWSIILLATYWLSYFDLIDGNDFDDPLEFQFMVCINVIAFTGINVAVTLYSLIKVEDKVG